MRESVLTTKTRRHQADPKERFGVQPSGCAGSHRLKPVLQTSLSGAVDRGGAIELQGTEVRGAAGEIVVDVGQAASGVNRRAARLQSKIRVANFVNGMRPARVRRPD